MKEETLLNKNWREGRYHMHMIKAGAKEEEEELDSGKQIVDIDVSSDFIVTLSYTLTIYSARSPYNKLCGFPSKYPSRVAIAHSRPGMLSHVWLGRKLQLREILWPDQSGLKNLSCCPLLLTIK